MENFAKVFPSTQSVPQSQRLQFDDAHQEAHEPNVGHWERIAGSIIGGFLVFKAIEHPTLGILALGALGGGLIYRGSSGYCPLYHKLRINRAHEGAARPADYYQRGLHVEMAYTIERPAEELYRYWRNFENLPHFMHHVESVTNIDDLRSHWVVKGPAGQSVGWDAEIINEQPNQLIAWRSLDKADVDNTGSVRFVPAPGDRGTEVRVSIEYIPPAGKLGAAVAWLFGQEPRQQIQEDLRRFKRLMEAGDILTTEGQPQGKCGR